MTKTFKKVVALDNFNFEMAKGTLTSGELKVLGFDARGNEQKIQEKISYMPQRFGLYEDLTIVENMTLYADLHGVKKICAARDICAALGNDGA